MHWRSQFSHQWLTSRNSFTDIQKDGSQGHLKLHQGFSKMERHYCIFDYSTQTEEKKQRSGSQIFRQWLVWDDANLIFSILENQEKLSKVHGKMMMKASGPVDWKMSFLPSKSIETQGQWMAMAKVYCYCDAISFN